MRRRPACLFLLCYILLLLILHFSHVPLVPEPFYRPEDGSGYLTLSGRVAGMAEREDYTELILNGTAAGNVRVTGADLPACRIGSPLTAEGLVETVEGPANPGQFDAALYYRTRGVHCLMKNPAVCRVLTEEEAESRGIPRRTVFGRLRDGMSSFFAGMRSRFVGRICRVFPEDAAGVLCAMLAGDRSRLSEDASDLWRAGGLTHMLAISGLHLSLLGMGLYRLLRRAGSGIPAGVGVSSAAMLAYTVFTGASVSTLRACVMFLLAASADLAGRTYDTLTAMSLAGTMILLGNPSFLFYSGFQMSFAAVLICALFGARGNRTAAVMLYLGMAPLVLRSFSELPLFSVPLNLAFVPALPVILLTGIIGTVLGGVFSYPSFFLLRGLEWVMQAVKSLPGSVAVLGCPPVTKCLVYYAALAAWAWLMKKMRLYKRRLALYLLVPALLLLLGPGPRRELKITFLSVGQGDGIVLELPGGKNVMIDAGSSSVREVGKNRVEPFLRSEGITRLDYVFATHMDEDHVNGIRELIARRQVRIRNLVMPDLGSPGGGAERNQGESARERMAAEAEKAGIRVLYLAEGDYVVMNEVRIDVFGPCRGQAAGAEDDNALCLVLSLRYRDFDALFTGDVEGEGEENVERILSERKQGCEVLNSFQPV